MYQGRTGCQLPVGHVTSRPPREDGYLDRAQCGESRPARPACPVPLVGEGEGAGIAGRPLGRAVRHASFPPQSRSPRPGSPGMAARYSAWPNPSRRGRSTSCRCWAMHWRTRDVLTQRSSTTCAALGTTSGDAGHSTSCEVEAEDRLRRRSSFRESADYSLFALSGLASFGDDGC